MVGQNDGSDTVIFEPDGSAGRRRLVALAEQTQAGDAAAKKSLSDEVCFRFNKGRWGAHLGIEATHATPELARGRMPWQHELSRGGDILHGGAVMGLIDHLSGLILMSDPRNILARQTGVTIEFNVSLLRAARQGEGLHAEVSPLRSGRNLVYMQGDAYGVESGVHVARARITSLLVSGDRVKALGTRPTSE